MTKVSVVIPVYNASKYLKQCLDSVFNQTLSDIEIICVDDGSTDDSLSILNEYASKDGRIKILQQKNQYAGVARNNGMSVATGEYIHFMDSDDWIEENTYEKLYSVAKENNVDFVKFKYSFYDEKTQQKYSNACSDIANIDVRFFERVINVKDNFEILAQAPDSPWSGFYNLEFLKSNNCVFDDFICANDAGFFFRCLANAKNVYLSNEKFVNYRVNIATSLVSRRAYHFDCQIALYEVMDRYMQSYPSEMGDIVRKILLDALFINYKKFIKYKNLEKSIKKDIKNQTVNFVKTIDSKLVSKRFKKLYRILKVQGLFNHVNNIKVSVIVPVYNAEKYLRQCLNSLKSQSLSKIEFICVNDGSTDKSLEILNEYAKKDSRFIVINQENSGSGQARNNALKIAKGEYIGFVDSDDIVSKNYFKALYTASKNGKYDIVATSKIKLFKDGDKKTRRKHVGLRNRKYLIKDNYEKSNIILATGSAVNKIYKRDFINQNKISFIDVKSPAEDNYFTACAIICAKEIKVINNATYFYRENQVSQTKVKIDMKSALKAFDVYTRIVEYIKNNVSKNLQTLWIDVIKRRAKLDIFTYIFEHLKSEEKEEFLNIANEKFKEFPTTLVVSLTSFPARINFVYKTIETLLNQSLKADRVILWLAEEQFENKEEALPKTLLDLREKGLEIKWCEDIKSYKKLIPTLEEYPDSIVVTDDDDILYPNNWLNDLYRNYLQNPNEIQCCRAHRISFDKCGNVLPYKDWVFEIFNVKSSYNNFFTGCGGVLYPPNSLCKDVLNDELFIKLCPTADDIWFWAMAVLNNTKINVINDQNKFELKYVDGSQDNNCLWKINVCENRNDIQLKNIFEYYPQILEKLDKKNIKNPHKLTFAQKIFSIREESSNHKKYTVVRILGLKLAIKRGDIKSIFSIQQTNNHKQHIIISFLGLKFKIKPVRTSKNKNEFIDYVLNNQLDKSCFVPISNNAYDWNKNKTKLISFYLPQFHNFPENEEYFGRGFTEWSNVTKAVPQYTGHYQPHLPIDVGFYNLETTDIMKRQIELAKMYGIYGFSFYYYWFSGKKVMNKPIEMLLADKSLDMPFYVFWANEDWSRLWDDGSDEILYKCEINSNDAEKFMNDILPLMKDARYIKIDGKPLLTIYNLKRYDLEVLQNFIVNLRRIAKENGFDDLYIMTIRKPYMNIHNLKEYKDLYGIDAIMEFIPGALTKKEFPEKFVLKMNDKFYGNFLDMEKYVSEKNYLFDTNCTLYKGCFPHWDNTSRKCYKGSLIFEQSPKNYKIWLKDIIQWTQKHNNEDEQFVFINAWNEWAEGAHLEPDRKYGYAYLQATKEALEETTINER